MKEFKIDQEIIGKIKTWIQKQPEVEHKNYKTCIKKKKNLKLNDKENKKQNKTTQHKKKINQTINQ